MGRRNIERGKNYFDFYDEFISDGHRFATTPKNVRQKIRTFLETYDITSTSFQHVIGVNSNTFQKFMNGYYKNQWNASSNGTYMKAMYFFYAERKLGKDSIAATLKRAATEATSGRARATTTMTTTTTMTMTDGVNEGGNGGEPSSSLTPSAAVGASSVMDFPSSAPKTNASESPGRASVGQSTPRGMPTTARAIQKPPLPNVSHVKIDERVFLTPKEVRAEISALKRKFKFNNTELGRACAHHQTVQPGAPVSRFLASGGDFGGQKMDIYVPLVHFVEKMRVHENRPKSAKRVALELETAPFSSPFLGFDPKNPGIHFAGEYLTKDYLGRNDFTRLY